MNTQVREEFYRMIEALTDQEKLKVLPWFLGYVSLDFSEKSLSNLKEVIECIKGTNGA